MNGNLLGCELVAYENPSLCTLWFGDMLNNSAVPVELISIGTWGFTQFFYTMALATATTFQAQRTSLCVIHRGAVACQ